MAFRPHQGENSSPGIDGFAIDLAARETRREVFDLPSRFCMDRRIVGEEVPRQAIGQDGPRETLEDQDRIVAESAIDLRQALRELRAGRDPLQLVPQRLFGDPSLPEPLESERLTEIGRDLSLENGSRHGFVERARGAGLVRVVGALDGRLSRDALRETELMRRGLSGNVLGEIAPRPLSRDAHSGTEARGDITPGRRRRRGLPTNARNEARRQECRDDVSDHNRPSPRVDPASPESYSRDVAVQMNPTSVLGRVPGFHVGLRSIGLLNG
jgi:hypothetical protein